MLEALLAVAAWLLIVFVVCRALRANGSDVDADEAAESVRQSLDPDHRLDELRSYTRPHVRAISETRMK